MTTTHPKLAVYSRPHQARESGFTLIEMMVALALFTIVITIAVGAFLSLIGQSSQLQGEQKVMTSLNFAMDNMTREIRTGIHYYCIADVADVGSSDEDDLLLTRDCAGNGAGVGVNGMSFVEAGSSLSAGTSGGRIAYGFDSASSSIVRQIAKNAPQSLTSSDVKITGVWFYVSGADPLTDGNLKQATVTIIIKAQDPDDTSRTYTMETTVTQRQLDL